MNGIGLNVWALENNTIRSTIENNSLPVLSGAWCYQTQTTKKPAVTRAYGLFLPSSARRYETLNHSHSIINEGGKPSNGAALRLAVLVDTMKNTMLKLTA